MKRHLTYIVSGMTMPLVYFLLATNLYVYASDVLYIAFSSERDGNYEIYVVDTKEKNLQNLTNHPARDFMPAFSPDGRWMVYVSDQDGSSKIYPMNRNNNIIRPLTSHLASAVDFDPDWSPNK